MPGLRTLREYQRSWMASDLGGSDPETAVAPAGALALLTGLIILAVGLDGIVVISACAASGRRSPGSWWPCSWASPPCSCSTSPRRACRSSGSSPRACPASPSPTVQLADLGALFSGALGIALVAVADTTVLSQSLAAQRDETVDPNQELRALGVANLAAGLFQGFSISSSSSRTPVAVAAGARSKLTPLVGAVTIALVLVLAPSRATTTSTATPAPAASPA